MEQYRTLLKEILRRGDVQFEPRTQEYILGKSGPSCTYDTRVGFPLMTTKNIPPRLPFGELFWKLRGERNVKSLVNEDINIWTANAYDKYLKQNNLTKIFPKHTKDWNDGFEQYKKTLKTDPESVGDGDLGPVYGNQWRHWLKPIFIPGHKNYDDPLNGIWVPDQWTVKEMDQLKNLIKNIKEKPGSRYLTLSAWNVGDLEDMALGPCPFWHQFSVWANGYMDLAMGQRSCDVFLGVPFNIAQDALLLHMIANETGYTPRNLTTQLFNAHAYLGVPPRSNFWLDSGNVAEFQKRFGKIRKKSEYLDLRDWYLKNAPPESEGNERKDHIPFILEQLSKTPRELPTLEIQGGVPLLDAIEMPAIDSEKEIGYAKLIGYNPEKWDSKAVMAA